MWALGLYELVAVLAAVCVYNSNMKIWRDSGEPMTFWDTPFIMVLSWLTSQLWPFYLVLWWMRRADGCSGQARQ